MPAEFSATLAVATERVDRLDKLVIEQDNVVAAHTDLGSLRAIGDRWLATKGLAAGERVIVEGLQRVRPGADVKPVPAGTAAAK